VFERNFSYTNGYTDCIIVVLSYTKGKLKEK
jgi:hypothetical protein